jgi:hypothetical protein
MGSKHEESSSQYGSSIGAVAPDLAPAAHSIHAARVRGSALSARSPARSPGATIAAATALLPSVPAAALAFCRKNAIQRRPRGAAAFRVSETNSAGKRVGRSS